MYRADITLTQIPYVNSIKLISFIIAPSYFICNFIHFMKDILTENYYPEYIQSTVSFSTIAMF